MATQDDSSEQKIKSGKISAESPKKKQKEKETSVEVTKTNDNNVTNEQTDLATETEEKKLAAAKPSLAETSDLDIHDSEENATHVQSVHEAVVNPYKKCVSRTAATDATPSDSTLPVKISQLKQSEETSVAVYPKKRTSPNIDIMITAEFVNKYRSTTPQKQETPNINIMNTSRKKSKNSPLSGPVTLVVEGYAFHDDIIGVSHRKSNGDEAFNLTLRNMIFNKELENEGFSSYVSLRDKSSGKEDLALNGEDGYPRYLFLSINVHHYVNAAEANEHVLEQCRNLHTVRIVESKMLHIHS